MNWLVLIVTFAIAVLVGAFLATTLGRTRSDWSTRRRLWTAALALPGFIVFATLLGVGCTMTAMPAQGAGNRDLVIAVYAMLGAVFLVITLVGGLVGAFAAVRKDGQ
jgi:hypothetical protein